MTFNIKIVVILKLILSEQLSTNSNIIIRAKLVYFSLCKFKINIPGIIKLHQKYKLQKSKPRFLLVTAPIVVQRDITPCINYIKVPKMGQRETNSPIDVYMVNAN